MLPEFSDLAEAAKKLLEAAGDSVSRGASDELSKQLSGETAKRLRQVLDHLKALPNSKKEFNRNLKEVLEDIEFVALELVKLRTVAEEKTQLEAELKKLRIIHASFVATFEQQAEDLTQANARAEKYSKMHAGLLASLNGPEVRKAIGDYEQAMLPNPFSKQAPASNK